MIAHPDAGESGEFDQLDGLPAVTSHRHQTESAAPAAAADPRFAPRCRRALASYLAVCALLPAGYGTAHAENPTDRSERLAAVEFNAAGVRPHWFLHLDAGGSIRFVVEGTAVFVSSGGGAALDLTRSGAIYGVSGSTQQFIAEITARRCWDTTTETHLPHTVIVKLNAVEYRGCGTASRR